MSAKDDCFVSWELPAREYVICGFEAENFEQLINVAINWTMKYSHFWLEKHKFTIQEYSPDMYYDRSPESSYMELWMPVNKVKK